MKAGLELKQEMSSGDEASEMVMMAVVVEIQWQTAGLPGLPV